MRSVALACVLFGTAIAQAQPRDPYTPQPAPIGPQPPPPVPTPPTPQPPELPPRGGLTTAIPSGLCVGLIGPPVGAFFSKDTPAGGAVPMGVATAGIGGLTLPRLIDHANWNEGQIRTVGSGTVWGGFV